MLTRRIIPCLDCHGGRVVKGVRFAGLRDAGDPAELAAAYEAQGADELVLLDVSATPEDRRTRTDTVRAVRAVLSIPLTVGGGVRTRDDARGLLEAGADKVAVNTAAVADPALLTELADEFGCQCTVLAVDAARSTDPERRNADWQNAAPALGVDHASPRWEVVIRSGRERTGLDAVAWCAAAVARGAGEILLTSWDRDGTQSGYDLDLLRAVSARVCVPVIASGGAATPQHLCDALAAGADAVLAASIFHYGHYTVAAIKKALVDNGVCLRL